jgi:hypothetical protein
MQHYGNELSALPEGRLLVDLCTITWGGYSAEADLLYWCGRTWRTWLKCNARLGKALRFPLILLFGLRRDRDRAEARLLL